MASDLGHTHPAKCSKHVACTGGLGDIFADDGVMQGIKPGNATWQALRQAAAVVADQLLVER